MSSGFSYDSYPAIINRHFCGTAVCGLAIQRVKLEHRYHSAIGGEEMNPLVFTALIPVAFMGLIVLAILAGH